MASEKESLITALADKTPVVPPAENHAEEDYFHNTLASKLRAALWPGTFGVIDSLYIKGGGTYTEIPLTTGGSPGTGTVTGVTGTAPILSNGNTVTPNISIEAASSVNPGSMSAADKIKLDGVETNANKYVHPGSHPPSIILQDTSNRFVTDAEKATWNAGGGGSTGTVTGVLGAAPIVSDGNTTTPTMSITAATTAAAGSMSGADKTKLDGIAPNANNYVHPVNHPPEIITQDASNRFVTDTEKATWNGSLRLNGSNTMSGPVNLAANGGAGAISVIPDLDYGGAVLDVFSADGVVIRGPFVFLDTPNAIISVPGATQGSPVIVAGIDAAGNAQLGYGVAGVPGYSVSDTHNANVVIKAANAAPPTAWVTLGLSVTLTQAAAAGTATLAFEVELQNTTIRTGTVEFGMRLNGVDNFRDVIQQIPANYQSTVIMSVPLINGYSSGDVIQLIARVTANNNNQFELTMLASASNLATMRFQTLGGAGGVTSVTGTAPIVSSGGAAPAISITAATQVAAGSMSGADKLKLDGVATGANNYVHPVNHPPEIITQDASNRFVTDTEKATWDAKASLSIANTWSERQRWGDANSDTYTVMATGVINLSLGAVFHKTVGANTSFTITGQDSTGYCSSFIIQMVNGGSYTVSWPSGVMWAGGIAPVLSVNGMDILGFYTIDGGQYWKGMMLAKDIK